MTPLIPVEFTPKHPFELLSEFGDVPLVHALPPGWDPSEVFLRLRHLPHCIWLDSAKTMPSLGRYSFLSADPVDWITHDDAASLPPHLLSSIFERVAPILSQPAIADLPPFQGGLAGMLGYDLNRAFESIAAPRYNDLPTPAIALGLYDWTICFDHHIDRAWIISQGWPETDPDRRRQAAMRRMQQIHWWLQCTPTAIPLTDVPQRKSLADLAPQFATPLDSRLTSNFPRGGFRDVVAQAIESIRAGDMFQVNLAQRLLFPNLHGAADLYLRMRCRNPAPFAGFIDGGDWQVISASPERFLHLADRLVETRPIKGTCQRIGDAIIDHQLGEALMASEKDRAENVMIVDLMRNDLSRVCSDQSIRVTELCVLEPYQYVQHLVSRVEGRLRSEVTPAELLAATFPGGSVTGAPKVMAMQKIAQWEPTARGPYCGSLGYWSTGNRLDWNILIRTVTCRDGWLQIPVGGGITAQSTPEREEQETWEKATGMLRAVL